MLGGSWGSTLALAYAEQHPTHVAEMVLFSVATTTAWQIDWITRGIGVFFPSHGPVFATEFRKQSGTAASSRPIIGSS